MTKKHLALLVLTLAVLLLAGCMQYQDDLVIFADGSGELSILMGVDMEMMEMFGEADEDEPFFDEPDEEFEEMDGVRVIRQENFREENWEYTQVVYGFDSIEQLMAALTETDDDAAADLGLISWTQEADGTWMFSRVIIDMDMGFDDDEMDAESLGMMSMFFGDAGFTYTVTFPNRVLETNANEEDIDYGTNTVTWRVSMMDMIQQADLNMWARVAQ